MAKYLFNIVGAFYRPPAKAILEALPAGAPLILRAEPDNPFDSNAVQVLSRSASWGESAREKLKEALPLFGHDLDETLSQPEWHLGYIPKGDAAALHGMVQCDVTGELRFSAAGQPQVGTDLLGTQGK